MSKRKNYPIAIIGTGPGVCAGGRSGAPESLIMLFQHADCICAGKQLLDFFDAHIPARIERLRASADIAGLILQLKERRDRGLKIMVLTGGDPLFFGLGATLSRHFTAAELLIYPAVSSMQEACARLALPWGEMRFVSLHGRATGGESPWLELARASLSQRPICLLLDATVQISTVASFLLERGRKAFTMHYFRGLQKSRESDLTHYDAPLQTGVDAGLEQHFSLRPEEAVRFSPDFSMLPSLLVLVPDAGRTAPRPYLGLPDETFACRNDLITKQPVRAAILAALRLRPDSLLLDLGAGSGSVALEALALLPEGAAYAVEKNPERVAQIHSNRQRHGAANLEIIQGDGRLLLGHPDFKLRPDRIFIGGGLNKGSHLLRQAWAILPAGGRLAVACILLGTLERTRRTLEEFGVKPEITAIQAARSAELAGDLQLKANNQVFIVTADKPAAQG